MAPTEGDTSGGGDAGKVGGAGGTDVGNISLDLTVQATAQAAKLLVEYDS